MLISLVIPVFALLVIGGIIWMIIEGIVHISKKNKAIDNFFNKVNKVSETYKFATTFLFLILATAGISQFYLYYIVSEFLFLLVIFTFGIAGIIFLMPYGLCFLPLYKQKKKKQTFKKIHGLHYDWFVNLSRLISSFGSHYENLYGRRWRKILLR